MKKMAISLLVVFMTLGLLISCGKDDSATSSGSSSSSVTSSGATASAKENNPFKGEELSILVSAGWMDNRYDDTIARFEKTYGVTVDLQTIPANQYEDLLQSKLATGSCTDIFWIQSNPFAIDSVIVDPEKYCIDFSNASWRNIMPETRIPSCSTNGKLYGLQIWHNSPEYVMVYNKTLFNEWGLEIPTTYNELLALCETIAAKGITPWFMPGADGWQHQLTFFQIGGLYEATYPGLYDKLNNNTATFANNQKMLEVLEQFKEISDNGYFGADWIGTDSTNMINEFGDRNIAMAVANSSAIKQIHEDTGTADEFGLFLVPLGDNSYFPTSPAGPTMFGYKGTKNQALVEEFFSFVCETESLQEILDNSPAYTNLDVEDPNLVQHWLPAEEEFMATITDEQMATSVLQNGTKYTNDYWMDFGADLVAYCLETMSANDVLANMDRNRADAAKIAGDPAWQ